MLELVTFRLAAGADEDAFLTLDARVQTGFAYQQPGLVRRTTARGAAGDWLVLTIWASEADADAARAAAARDALTAESEALIDASTKEVRRYTALD